MILSTLAELEDVKDEPEAPQSSVQKTIPEEAPQKSSNNSQSSEDYEVKPISDVRFLQNVRERILVLFEGFQSPNNQNIEAKVDLTLNFLEYLLASIDEQLEKRDTSTHS